MAEQYQLVVIGAGPGGYVAAIRAAQLGLRVAVVEDRAVGGTCLNRGCIPTKALLHSAELLEQIRASERFGIRAEGVSYDFPAIHARKDEVVSQLVSGIEGLFQANKITLVRGKALVADARTVRVGDTVLEAENILIATGSEPVRPPIPGLELPGVVTSDALLTGGGQDYKQLLIIGGGVIGVEFATVYGALGCEVTIVEAMDRILPTMDREISQNLSMILKRRGVKIFTGARVERIEQAEGGLACTFSAKGKEQAAQAEGVLVSIGRRANTEGLFAQGLDLHLERGAIPVDERFESCVKGIYAIGDVVKGNIQLAHVASAQGLHVAAVIAGEQPSTDLSLVPSCIYTNPEIASVGMTEADAKAAGIPVRTGKFIMSANGKTVIEMADRGFIKVVFDSQTNRLLGAQMMCCRATDMIGELCTAIRGGMTLEQLASVIRPHPTFNEAVTEAVEDVLGHAVHAAPKRR